MNGARCVARQSGCWARKKRPRQLAGAVLPGRFASKPGGCRLRRAEMRASTRVCGAGVLGAILVILYCSWRPDAGKQALLDAPPPKNAVDRGRHCANRTSFLPVFRAKHQHVSRKGLISRVGEAAALPRITPTPIRDRSGVCHGPNVPAKDHARASRRTGWEDEVRGLPWAGMGQFRTHALPRGQDSCLRPIRGLYCGSDRWQVERTGRSAAR